MEIKCSICGYIAKDTTVCPRCRTSLSCETCSGNCFSCHSYKSKDSVKK